MAQRFFILQPATVFTALVDQSTFAYPIDEVNFDTVGTGAFGDIEVGMTVLFGTTAGDDDLGRQRIRKAADSDTIFFGRSSENINDGEVDLTNNCHITVLDDYRVWSKIPFIEVTSPDGVTTVTHYKDSDLTVGTNTTDPPPVSNIGPGAGFANDIDGSNIITVGLDGTDSFATDTGASISTYLWDVDDGTITVGTSASSAITATFPAGFRWVSLTVTDSNGKTHTSRYPVYARNPASDTTVAAQIIEHTITRQGQRMGIRLLEDVAETSYPDGTLVMVWEGDPADKDDRDHMLFVGWHQNDPSLIEALETATIGDTTMVCLDAAMKLDTLPAFPQSVENKASPSTWLEMANLNADLMFHYMLHWHSTFLEVANWTWSGTGSTYAHIRFDTAGASLFDQVAELTRKLSPDYHFTFSRQGEGRVLVDPMLQDTGSRTATVQTTLTEALWSRIEYTRQRPPRTHWRRAGAILADTTGENTVFCVAPGEAPGQGELEEEDNVGLAPSQAVLNATEGHRYARINAHESPFTISLAQAGNSAIEPADMTWVQLTISATTAARRGLTFSTARGLPVEMNVAYEYSRTGLVKQTELVWERETSGNPAVTYIIPEDEVIVPDPSDYPDPGTDPQPTPLGFGTLWVLVDGALGRTRDVSLASPNYSQSDLGPGGTTYYDLILDPWAPETTAYLSSAAGLYKSTNINLDSPTWSLVLSAATIASATSGTLGVMAKVHGSINQQDYVAVFYGVTGVEEIWCSFSENAGSTWTHNLISSDFSTVSAATGEIVDHTIGGSLKLYSAHNTGSGRKLFVSTNKGDTWSSKAIAGASSSAAVCVHSPYDDNANGNVVYVALSTGAWRSTDGGDSWTALAHITHAKDGIGTYTQDRQRVYIFKSDNTFYISTDGGDNWTSKATTGLSGTVRTAGGFPYNNGLFFALTTAGIFLTVDGGNTFVNKTGNWPHGFTITQYAGGTVVPLWTE